MVTKKKSTDKAKASSKPAAKKAVAKKETKPAAKKATAKDKPAAKKAVAKKETKPVAKKATAKNKPAAKKAVAKKETKPVKKTAVKTAAKPAAKKAVEKGASKSTAKKTPASKATANPSAKTKAVVENKAVKGKSAEKVKPVKAKAKTENNASVPLAADKGKVDMKAPEPKTLQKPGGSKRRAGRLPKPKVEKTVGIRDMEETHPELKKPSPRPDFSSPYSRRTLGTKPMAAKRQEDNRSRYSDEELLEFKELIMKKLHEAKNDFDLLKDTLSNKTNGTDDTSPTFKLLEDGSDVLTKEETAQLAVRQQKFIQNLENALIRIENKTYGICRATGKLISKDRLRVVPHATLSIEAKNAQ